MLQCYALFMGETMEEKNRFKCARTKYNQHGPQSVKDAAKETGVTGSLIDDLESSVGKRRDVGYSKIIALAKHYGVTTDYLLGLTDDQLQSLPPLTI